MKTDPRTEALSAVGPLAYTLPPLYDGWTVIAVTGGTVTRAGDPLTPGATLAAGNELTFTPAGQGGTTTLAVQQEDAEFSGNYADLSGIPAGAGVDTEAVQDIVAAMLGTVGSYNDAAGTYTITLPQPRTDEDIQDVVAALIQAGANVTKTYNDAGNVLTLSASGGGAAGGVNRGAWQPSTTYAQHDIVRYGSVMYSASSAHTSGAAFDAATWTAFPAGVPPTVALSGSPAETPPGTPGTNNFGTSIFGQFRPSSNIVLTGLRSSGETPGRQIVPEVWRVSDGALMATGPAATVAGDGTVLLPLTQAFTLLGGTDYRIGERGLNGNVNAATNVPSTTYTRFAVSPGVYYGSGYPGDLLGGYSPTFTLLHPGAAKGVAGPLDPVDMPIFGAPEDVPAGAWGLLTSGAAPRLVFRTYGGVLHYGALFTTSP